MDNINSIRPKQNLQANLAQSLKKGEGSFAAAKVLHRRNLWRPQGVKRQAKNPIPKGSLTRLLTGDVRPEWLKGLGRMKDENGTLVPADGYKDSFVSSEGELNKRGVPFRPTRKNNPVKMASKLDLKAEDVEKVRKDGAWLLVIHPGSKLAIPTERQSQWNPEYREGGYTKSNQQEWVTPNVALEPEVRAGNIHVYKLDPSGKTTEWKFFQGKLMPLAEWRQAIDAHVQNVAQR